MELPLLDFFHDFRQELMAGAEANSEFQLTEFMGVVSDELIETGFIEGFEFCHYRAQRGMRVDGYWFNDEGALDLFIADFESRDEIATLTQTDVNAAFKRVANFFDASVKKSLYKQLEETSPEYGLSRQISDRRSQLQKVNFFLFSERSLSDRIQTLDNGEIANIPAAYHIWDISRIQRQRSSRGHKEALDIDFESMFGTGIPSLSVNIDSETYESYLSVIPGGILAAIYEKYGARLLEQNVRSFLQARGNVNKGIRSTIINEPHMFFAYNNGITATAEKVEFGHKEGGMQIVRIKDLQIVNGGQTTASLFHTLRTDKASLDNVFVQMKISVINSEVSETVVPRISEYANTQNRVNAADFFSNHPFHVRIEEFSRRIWAPVSEGSQRETKWFYERARGQYVDAQSKLTKGGDRRFKAEFPKHQMFTKTELAKFENVWDEHPKWVNLGSMKNFARYATRIGEEWVKSPLKVNEYYYKRAIARNIIFRQTEKMVSKQAWYNGGYRANIVAYAIASINACCSQRKMFVDYLRVWNSQTVYPTLFEALTIAAEFVNNDISMPPSGISNISEWCKKTACWQRILEDLSDLAACFPERFWDDLVSVDEEKSEEISAKKTQKMDDGISAQIRVYNVPKDKWTKILELDQQRKFLTSKETDIIRIAQQIPLKMPTDKQSVLLEGVLVKAAEEGI